MKKLIRVATYLRYSSDNQREESISAQLKAVEEYCRRKGYILVKVYIDEAKSATTDQRHNFLQMICDSELGIFDVVVVHKLDRFARNRYDSAFYKRKLKLNNVSLESVLEQFDNSPESIILESVLEGMAEYYSKNLAREVLKGLNENAVKAIHNGGRPPYGLKVNPANRQYEIDEKRYKAVQMYFNGVDNDIPLAKIAKQINAAGFRTYTGEEFKVTSFDTWAYNRKYKGDYVWNASSKKDEAGKRNSHKRKPLEEQIIIPGIIPAIVQADQFDRVCAKMEDRRRKGGRMKAKLTYLLSGKVFCGVKKCRKVYVGQSYASRNSFYAYYKCEGKCGNKNIKKEVLEQIVIDQLTSICFSDEAMANIVTRVKSLYTEKHSNAGNESEDIKRELQALDKKINNWIDAIGDGVLDRNSLAAKIKEANEKKAFLEAELSKITAVEATKDISDEAILKILKNKKHLLFSGTDTEKKQVLQEYIESVYVIHNSDKSLDVEMTVRLFNGGGELLLLETLTLRLLSSNY